MYSLGDESAAVREIQKYLHFISERDFIEIPRVAIDGVYGEETKDAVKAFQKYKNILPSGEIDYETFQMLYEEYLNAKLLYEAEEFLIDAKNFPYKYGDSGNDVLLLNIMLNEMSEFYSEMNKVDLKPYFSSETEKAVKSARKIFILGDTAYIDAIFYDRMRYELLIRGGID